MTFGLISKTLLLKVKPAAATVETIWATLEQFGPPFISTSGHTDCVLRKVKQRRSRLGYAEDKYKTEAQKMEKKRLPTNDKIDVFHLQLML